MVFRGSMSEEMASSFIDEESLMGRFGWTTIGDVHIPYILRSGGKFCSVSMVELKLLDKYLKFLHEDIHSCACIKSYYITVAEKKLLDEINIVHCDSQFGKVRFTNKNLICRLSDVEEFYCFLTTCYNKLLNWKQNATDRCGFIIINKQSVVPYIVYNEQKYLPLFYFEGDTASLIVKAKKLDGWDLAYLKFCFKVQGIKNELITHVALVISLDDVKNVFPSGTIFEDYWPSKTTNSQLLINDRAQSYARKWIKYPVTSEMEKRQAKQELQTLPAGVFKRIQLPPLVTKGSSAPTVYKIVFNKSTDLESTQINNMQSIDNQHNYKIILLPKPSTGTRYFIQYQMQEVSVQGKMLTGINRKPYVLSELLVTLQDVAIKLLDNVSLKTCSKIMSTLGIEMYRANSEQMTVLMANGKCKSLNEVVFLVEVKKIIDFMPQLNYIIRETKKKNGEFCI